MNRVVIAALCCLACASAAAEQSGKSFYRWTDKDGKVHYGDHMPPEQSKLGGVKFDASGTNKQAVEGAKSSDQLAAEALLRRLRSEQDRLFAEQADRDQALLRSFRNEEEVRMALQGNLNALNSQVKIIETNLQRQQEKLIGLQQQADKYKSEGKQVPSGIAENLNAAQRQLATYQQQVAKSQTEMEVLKAQTERDVVRLKALRSQMGSGRSLSESARSNPVDTVVGAVPCHIKETCDKGWNSARDFLIKFRAEPLAVDSERVLRTAEPANESELALTVIRSARPDGEVLFLDVRCARQSLGLAACSDSKTQEVRQAFRNALAREVGLTAQ